MKPEYEPPYMFPSVAATGVMSRAGSWSGSPRTWLVSHSNRPVSRCRHTTFPLSAVATKSPLGSTVKDVYERGPPCALVQMTFLVPMSKAVTEPQVFATTRTDPDTAPLAVTLAPRWVSRATEPEAASRKMQRPSTAHTATSPVW